MIKKTRLFFKSIQNIIINFLWQKKYFYLFIFFNFPAIRTAKNNLILVLHNLCKIIVAAILLLSKMD